jgi:hypothetical protein
MEDADVVSSGTRGEFEGGRRPKRGRYSTGALFRPREKRVHRALGGEAASQWAWPEPEEEAKPAGTPGPASRGAEAGPRDERRGTPLPEGEDE